jgi:transketolase
MRDHFIQALTVEAQKNPDIVLITGDLGFSVLDDFSARFPDQFYNSGVAEQNMTQLAAGLALEGAKVFTYSIANFATLRCLEQIRNDVCYHELDVTIVAVGGGFSYGQLGMSHFATEDIAIMRALPMMKVVVPSDKRECEDLTHQLVLAGGPTYLRIDKGTSGQERNDVNPVQLGRLRTLRIGDDIAFICVGAVLGEAIAAAATLAAEGVEVHVASAHTVKPLDVGSILELAVRMPVVTIEEHNILGGLGGAVAEIVLCNLVQSNGFARVGLNDLYPEIVGDQKYLRRIHGIDAGGILQSARRLLR